MWSTSRPGGSGGSIRRLQCHARESFTRPAAKPVQEFLSMLDFYYTERLAARHPASPLPPLAERLERAVLPLGYLALRRVAELVVIAGTLPLTIPMALITACA